MEGDSSEDLTLILGISSLHSSGEDSVEEAIDDVLISEKTSRSKSKSHSRMLYVEAIVR